MTYISLASMTALGIVLPFLSVTALAMRIISHRRYFKTLGIDDMFIVPAFILSFGLGILVLVAARTGITSDTYATSTIPQYVAVKKLEYAFNMVYALGTGCIKLSILFFFRRVFRGVAIRTAFDYSNWMLIVLTACATISFFFGVLFECGLRPDLAWDTKIYKTGKCVQTLDFLVVWVTINFLLDLSILVEPLVIIARLHLTWAKKMQACSIFVISGFAVTASLMRMILMIQLQIQGNHLEIYNMVGLRYPVTAGQAFVTIELFWVYIEIGVGFLVACLLTSTKLLDAISDSAVAKKLRLMSSSFLASSKASVRSKATSFGGSSNRSKRSAYTKHTDERDWSSYNEATPMSATNKHSGIENIELVKTSSEAEDV